MAFDDNRKEVLQAYLALKRLVNQEELPIELYLGCELLLEPENIDDILLWLDEGRYPTMNETRYVLVELAKELQKVGVYIQVNLYSVVEKTEERVRNITNELLQEKMVSFVGTDAHRTNHRPPMIAQVEDMEGYGTYDMPEGTGSDDSSMALATLHSIGKQGGIDANFTSCYILCYGKEKGRRSNPKYT